MLGMLTQASTLSSAPTREVASCSYKVNNCTFKQQRFSCSLRCRRSIKIVHRLHATKEEQEKVVDPNVVEGYDITKPDIWESDFVGIAFKVGFVSACVGVVVTLLYLASPLINYVTAIYPSPDALQAAVETREETGGAFTDDQF